MSLRTDPTRSRSTAPGRSSEPASLSIVFIGLTITSSWGNGHATTYRALVRELSRQGHRTLFLEHDKPWYAENRDMPRPPFGRTAIYRDLHELKTRFDKEIRSADLVIVGSYVPEGVEVGRWVTRTANGVAAFYDIDTPVTLAKLRRGDCEYLTPELIAEYGLYLSFTGGPTLKRLERKYHSPMARALYCSVDPELYFPEPHEKRWQLGYLGTYSKDRQPLLNELLVCSAKRWPRRPFVVAGPQYPENLRWPRNVHRIEHLPPCEHRRFYNSQRFTLNITRADMVKAGYSPSVRLFEAAACGVPIISDWWEGLDQFFTPDKEILIARSAQEVSGFLRLGERRREEIGSRARRRILQSHTAARRAAELAQYANQALGRAVA